MVYFVSYTWWWSYNIKMIEIFNLFYNDIFGRIESIYRENDGYYKQGRTNWFRDLKSVCSSLDDTLKIFVFLVLFYYVCRQLEWKENFFLPNYLQWNNPTSICNDTCDLTFENFFFRNTSTNQSSSKSQYSSLLSIIKIILIK
jgi:hypothetical protein